MRIPTYIYYISLFYGVGLGASLLFNGDDSTALMLTLGLFMGWVVRRILRLEEIKIAEEIPAGIKCGFDTSDLAAARCERERRA